MAFMLMFLILMSMAIGRRVLETISKADVLCQLLNPAKTNVSGQSMT